MTTTQIFPTTIAARFTVLYALVAPRLDEIERAITAVHPATGCLPLPDFAQMRPTSYDDLADIGSALHDNQHGTNSGVADEWLTAYDACTHLDRETAIDVYALVGLWQSLIGALHGECASPRSWSNDTYRTHENAVRRIHTFTLDHIAKTDADREAATAKCAADLNAPGYTPVARVLLDATDSILVSDLRAEHPDIKSMETVTAANAAQTALYRGWVPNPADAHGMDLDAATYNAEVVISLDGGHTHVEKVILLGHSAVEWLNANNHVAAGGRAVLDAEGFRIVHDQLDPTRTAITANFAAGNPDMDAQTMINAIAVEAALVRGWEPSMIDDGIDWDHAKAMDEIELLDHEGYFEYSEVIEDLTVPALRWLNACDHVAPGHVAVLDDEGFRIIPEDTNA